MAIALRAGSAAYQPTTATPAVTKPTGTINDDVVIIGILAVTGLAFTPPSGFTLIGQQNNGGNALTAYVYWHRASSDPSSYSFSFSGGATDTTIACVSFSGVLLSGSPLDSGTAGSVDAPGPIFSASITTTVANAMRVFFTGNGSGASVSPSGNGFTQGAQVNVGVDIGTALFYQAQASAGASGIQSFTNGSLGSNQWAGFHFALKPETGATVYVPEALLVRRPKAMIDAWRL